MAQAFQYVLVAVVVVSVVVAVLSLHASRGLYDDIGKGSFALDTTDNPTGPPPDSAAGRAEAQAEIRQLVEAKSARGVARGEAPLDVDAEIAALNAPVPGVQDDALREEVRSMVVASNERRVRRGEAPVEVEREIDRQLRDLQE